MLQRLVLRPPSLLKPYPNDGVIFNKDGKLREQFYKLCQEININPEELYPRSFESFAEPDVIKNVQILKFNNYENKRRAKIEALRTVARQRNIPLYTKLPRAETASPPIRQESGLYGTESMNNVDKDNQRLGQSGLRDSVASGNKFISMYGGDKHPLQTQGSRNDHSTSFDFSSPALGSVGNKNIKTSDTGRMPSIDEIKGSMSNLDIAFNEYTMAEEMEEKFKKYMAYKTLHKERLMNASMMVSKKDQSHREQLKKMYEEKAIKWAQKRELLKKQQKKNKDQEEYRRERLMIQKENQEEAKKFIQEKMLAKIAKSELHRKQETEKRLTKLTFLNNTFQERRLNCKGKKDADENLSVEESLLDIENKFYISESRKKQFIQEKRLEAIKHFTGAEAKLQKVRQQEKVEEFNKLEKLLVKMDKGRCRSALLTKKRNEIAPKPIEASEDYIFRMEDKVNRENDIEKQRIEYIKEKERKGIINVQKRGTDLKELIAERRELWNQKRENIIENKEIANEAQEKYIEHRMKNYRDRVNQIKKTKEERKKQIERVNKSFTVGGL